jgi:hypothetical protein
MRGKSSNSLMLSLMISFWVLTTLAQAEQQKTQLFFVEEAVVKPSMVEKFESLTKEALALCEKYGFPFPFNAFTTDDFHYYFVWPIENYGSLNSVFKAIGEWVVNMGDENWQTLVKSGEGTHEYMKWSIIRHKPDLSLTPEKPRLKPEQTNYRYWGLCYVQPGKEKEFEDVFKKIITLYRSKNLKNIDYGWKLYMGDIGTDMPFYFFVHSGKNAADFCDQAEKRHEAMGKELPDLWWKVLETIRKYEYKTGWYRPDLSYTPKEM